jgi:hypothetical protein
MEGLIGGPPSSAGLVAAASGRGAGAAERAGRAGRQRLRLAQHGANCGVKALTVIGSMLATHGLAADSDSKLPS